jgi:hypothetical protein
MKVRLMLVQLILIWITGPAVFCQNDCQCTGSDEPGTGQYLPGELFTPTFHVDNSTYFNTDWLSGDIFLTDGRVIRNKKIRYNGFLDELLWLESESNQVVKLDKEAISKFHYTNIQGDTTVNFRKIKVKRNNFNDSVYIFGQELYQGDLSLYVLHSFYFDRSVIVHVEKGNIMKDIYKEEPVYYIKFLNNTTIGFKRFNRKNLYAFAPDKKDEIKKFLKESNSGKIKTTAEIISLVQFLDTIVNQ